MNTPIRLTFGLTSILVAMSTGSLTVVAQEISRDDFLALGRTMFEREWKPGEPATKKLPSMNSCRSMIGLVM